MIRAAVVSPERLRGFYSYPTIEELPLKLSEYEKTFIKENGWLRVAVRGHCFAAYDDKRSRLVCPLGPVGLVIPGDFLAPEREILERDGYKEES